MILLFLTLKITIDSPEPQDGAFDERVPGTATESVVLGPERGRGLPGALQVDGSSPPALAAPPAELPPHAYIFIEEGERERSGERAWLAMEGRGKILRTFHGADARRLARDWIGTKFGASPAGEIEVPLFEGEATA